MKIHKRNWKGTIFFTLMFTLIIALDLKVVSNTFARIACL